MLAYAIATNEHDAGYALYCNAKSITRCDSLTAARGWLEAQWDEGAAEADVWNVKHTALHPRHLSDTDVAGIIAQAEDIAEYAAVEERRRGY